MSRYVQGCHPECCVKRTSSKRERRVDNTGIRCPFPSKPSNLTRRDYACIQEKAYHIGERPFKGRANLRSPLPEQQEFHQHLRALAQSAVRTVLELVMREELDAFIGAAWGECSPKRKGYRNGTYTRDLATATGRLEEIKVPRDRAGQFHTQAFERYSRYEPHIAEGLTQMFVAGVSTHKVGEVAQTLMGVAPSASTISRLNQSLTQQFETWRQRPLQAHWRVLYLDGVHFSIRHGEKLMPPSF